MNRLDRPALHATTNPLGEPLGAHPLSRLVIPSRAVFGGTAKTAYHTSPHLSIEKRALPFRNRSALGLGEGHAVRGGGWRMTNCSIGDSRLTNGSR